MREIKFEYVYKNKESGLIKSAIKTLHELDIKGNTFIHTIWDLIARRQYTGLLDKQGVEIYEGDIVSIMDCEPSLYKIIWVDDMFRFDVQYIGTDLTNWKDESMGEFSSEDFTVVGNIYENPELLK